MPTRERVQAFVAMVEANQYVEAIRQFYAEDATMRLIDFEVLNCRATGIQLLRKSGRSIFRTWTFFNWSPGREEGLCTVC